MRTVWAVLASAAVITGAVFGFPVALVDSHLSVPYSMMTGSQLSEVDSHDSECGYACPITSASLICDVDGAWVVWLMPDQSVRVPNGRCSREDLPTVFDRLGEPVAADVIVVGE